MVVATKDLMLGLPPDWQNSLDAMTPEKRQDWIECIALNDRRERRKHNQFRQYVLKTEGADVGPYKSMYAWFWDHYRKEQAKAIASTDGAILGLEQGADITKRDVRNAYRRAARKLHPDVGGDAEAFKRLYAAYRAVLKVTRE